MVKSKPKGIMMILDTMTYSIMTVVVAMSFVVILLASQQRYQQGDKQKSNLK
jgi:hypothetical protein